MNIIKTISPSACAQGACPSFHLTDTGTVLVQGARLPANPPESLDIPDHEDVVAIPKDVFDAPLAQYNG
ncbi:MAG TPA: hypothetical protein PK640_17380 [Verrucomicrobiota bacterium]|nr:hypothetical protein [Verrucomicrobiota bacterium]